METVDILLTAGGAIAATLGAYLSTSPRPREYRIVAHANGLYSPQVRGGRWPFWRTVSDARGFRFNDPDVARWYIGQDWKECAEPKTKRTLAVDARKCATMEKPSALKFVEHYANRDNLSVYEGGRVPAATPPQPMAKEHPSYRSMGSNPPPPGNRRKRKVKNRPVGTDRPRKASGPINWK